jgi:hypothetical protein
MKLRAPEHPILLSLVLAGGLYWSLNAYQEHTADNQDRLTEILDARGAAALGGQAITLEGLKTDTVTRPAKPYKKPQPRLGSTEVLAARNQLLTDAGKTPANAKELVMASCVLAAVNAPNQKDVAPTLELANRHYTEGALEVAATNCTDYLVDLVGKKQNNFVTIIGVA